jgi:hypothetical protein
MMRTNALCVKQVNMQVLDILNVSLVMQDILPQKVQVNVKLVILVLIVILQHPVNV